MENTEKKNIHQGHRQRLRAMVDKKGLEGMPEHQVLEYMLSFVMPQKDTNVIAHRLIEKYGNITNVLEANQTSLAETDGIGEVVAHYLANFRNMFLYYQNSKAKNVTTLNNSREAYLYISWFLKNKLVEEMYVIGLDNKNHLLFTKKIGTGTVNKNNVSIRSIAELLVHYGATNVIVTHNHPGGVARPSAEDDRFTKALVCAMDIMDILVLDHIIINADGYYSYFISHKLQEYRDEVSKYVGTSMIAQDHAHYEA